MYCLHIALVGLFAVCSASIVEDFGLGENGRRPVNTYRPPNPIKSLLSVFEPFQAHMAMSVYEFMKSYPAYKPAMEQTAKVLAEAMESFDKRVMPYPLKDYLDSFLVNFLSSMLDICPLHFYSNDNPVANGNVGGKPPHIPGGNPGAKPAEIDLEKRKIVAPAGKTICIKYNKSTKDRKFPNINEQAYRDAYTFLANVPTEPHKRPFICYTSTIPNLPDGYFYLMLSEVVFKVPGDDQWVTNWNAYNSSEKSIEIKDVDNTVFYDSYQEYEKAKK